jgi:DNA-binding IclR family transcriptional regulator
MVATAEGAHSPAAEELITGYDDAAHATALGKAMLATLSADPRWRFLKEQGMPA